MRQITQLAALALAGQLVAFSGATQAAGFAIAEQSIKGLGSAFSNTAEAGDASTVFLGIIQLTPRRVVFERRGGRRPWLAGRPALV